MFPPAVNMKYVEMYFRIIVFLVVSMCFTPLAHSREWTFGEAAKELISQFSQWYAYDQISDDFVVFVPLDQDVVTTPVEGGAKRIAEDPDIFLVGTTTNAANTIRGELHYMKKHGTRDVFDAFKALIDKQKRGASAENISHGDRASGVYSFVYSTNKNKVTYESVINLNDSYAVSYRLTAENNTKEEDLAGRMVSNYTLIRRCAVENFGDKNCVILDPPL